MPHQARLANQQVKALPRRTGGSKSAHALKAGAHTLCGSDLLARLALEVPGTELEARTQGYHSDVQMTIRTWGVVPGVVTLRK